MRSSKILLSARDPGATGNIIALACHFHHQTVFDVHIVASGVAYSILRKAGQKPIHFSLSDKRDFLELNEDPSHLLQEAKRLFEYVEPDVIIVSLSSFGVGIDEALLAIADVPTFAVQDFWGDVNLGIGVPANLYFVLDEYAVELSQERWGVNAMAVGSPKYTLYERLDIPFMRESTRKEIITDKKDIVVGWFGQSPEIPGHEAVFNDFLNTIVELPEKPKLVLREHPKFQNANREHLDAVEKHGLRATDIAGCGQVEKWLASCDLVVTPFSLCGLDHAYLSAYSPEPIGTVLYLMTNEFIRNFAQDLCGLETFPTVKKGIGLYVTETAKLSEIMRSCFEVEAIEAYFENTKQLINIKTIEIISKHIETRLTLPDFQCISE